MMKYFQNIDAITMARIQMVNLGQKFSLFNEFYVKTIKLNRRLTIKPKDRDVHLKEGELVVIPHSGTEHKLVAKSGVELLLLEPKTTLNTGNIRNNSTADAEWI